jgi:hypothetical protein
MKTIRIFLPLLTLLVSCEKKEHPNDLYYEYEITPENISVLKNLPEEVSINEGGWLVINDEELFREVFTTTHPDLTPPDFDKYTLLLMGGYACNRAENVKKIFSIAQDDDGKVSFKLYLVVPFQPYTYVEWWEGGFIIPKTRTEDISGVVEYYSNTPPYRAENE